MSMDDLFAEAQRQLTICNSCRYCEGYCAVFPAVERHTVISADDLTHLANLCHDCRACYYACMYAPPHEFGVNPPAVLGEIRRATYDTYVKRPGLPAWLAGRGLAAAVILVGAAIVALVALTEGIGALWAPRHPPGSPYGVISYPALLVTVALPSAWSVGLMLRAAGRYWHDTHGPLRELADPRALLRALAYAASLRYLRGGGEDCSYPQDIPSPIRRRRPSVSTRSIGSRSTTCATSVPGWLELSATPRAFAARMSESWGKPQPTTTTRVTARAPSRGPARPRPRTPS